MGQGASVINWAQHARRAGALRGFATKLHNICRHNVITLTMTVLVWFKLTQIPMLTLKRFTMTLWCSLWCPPLGSVLICLADGTPQPPLDVVNIRTELCSI